MTSPLNHSMNTDFKETNPRIFSKQWIELTHQRVKQCFEKATSVCLMKGAFKLVKMTCYVGLCVVKYALLLSMAARLLKCIIVVLGLTLPIVMCGILDLFYIGLLYLVFECISYLIVWGFESMTKVFHSKSC